MIAQCTPAAATARSISLMPMNGAIDPAYAVNEDVAPQDGLGVGGREAHSS